MDLWIFKVSEIPVSVAGRRDWTVFMKMTHHTQSSLGVCRGRAVEVMPLWSVIYVQYSLLVHSVHMFNARDSRELISQKSYTWEISKSESFVCVFICCDARGGRMSEGPCVRVCYVCVLQSNLPQPQTEPSRGCIMPHRLTNTPYW